MEDGYKELIEKLHNIGDAPIGKHWSVLIDKSTLRDVIDVIERLVRERDDYEVLAKMYAKVNKDLCVRTKERDAAIKDLDEVIASTDDINWCLYCKHREADGQCHHLCVPCSSEWGWEWRGVQE